MKVHHAAGDDDAGVDGRAGCRWYMIRVQPRQRHPTPCISIAKLIFLQDMGRLAGGEARAKSSHRPKTEGARWVGVLVVESGGGGTKSEWGRGEENFLIVFPPSFILSLSCVIPKCSARSRGGPLAGSDGALFG